LSTRHDLTGLDRVADFPNHSHSYDFNAVCRTILVRLTRIRPDAWRDASGFLNAIDESEQYWAAALTRMRQNAPC
jgi:hypothetical protein